MQVQPKKKFSVPWLQYPSFKDEMAKQAPHEITVASGNYHKQHFRSINSAHHKKAFRIKAQPKHLLEPRRRSSAYEELESLEFQLDDDGKFNQCTFLLIFL